MSMTPRLMLADMQDLPAFSAVLDNEMVITNGHDRPRYMNPDSGVAGLLGMSEWSNHWQKPTVASTAGSGSLTADSWYSIKVVPVDTDRSYLAQLVLAGPETLPSIPVTEATEIEFTVPLHPDMEVVWAGYSQLVGTDTITFDDDSFVADALIGMMLRNVDTGDSYEITANTTSTITAAGITTLSGERFHVERSACKRRDIYVAEMESAEEVLTESYHYQGSINDNTTTAYTLSEYVASLVFPEETEQPPNAAVCESANKRVFLAGGIRFQGGDAWVNVTAQERTATATADEDAVFSIADDLYGGAGSMRVMRLTLGSALTAFSGLRRGSILTVAGASSSGNNVANLMILRADADGRWVEYYNNDGVAEADTGVVVTATPNIMTAADLNLAEGCIGHTITFEGESAKYAIADVNVVAQTATLATLYEGAATAEADAVPALMTSRSNLYRSSIGNPHQYSITNTHEINGNTKRLVAYTNALFIFTDTELYILPYESIDAGFPEHVFGNVFINAPHAIAASGTNGVLFWDGGGFSVTDGIRMMNVTNPVCRWLMDGVNKEMAHNFRAAWNPQESRWETAFAYGDGITNDYGLYITQDSRVYGIQRLDVNAIWMDVSEDGEPEMRHGSSARSTGEGIIWRHSHEYALDGTPAASAILGVVTAYVSATRTVTIETAFEMTAPAGTTLVFLGEGNTVPTAIAGSITETATDPYTYDIVLGQDWAGITVTVGSTVVIGGIPFFYGVRWSDFQSPQYLHQVRRTELDIEPTSGFLAIEHYRNLDESEPDHSDSKTLDYNTTKVVFPLRKSAMYQYGFTLRGVCLERILIDGFSTLFDTQV